MSLRALFSEAISILSRGLLRQKAHRNDSVSQGIASAKEAPRNDKVQTGKAMEIALSSNNSTITAKFSGSVTEADSPVLKGRFAEILLSGHNSVQLDLTQVPLMTSVGIGKLIVLHKNLKAQNRTLSVNGIHEDLFNMFSSINLGKMIPLNR